MHKTTFLLIICIVIGVNAFSQATVGLLQTNSAEDGYILFAPIKSDTTYLIDKCGRLIHQWGSTNTPGMSVYLLPDGSLLRSADVPNMTFRGKGSQGGMVEKYDWNNNLLWSYTISSTTETQNHDIYPMPNGNVLVVIWTAIDSNAQLAAGRKAGLILSYIFAVKIQELQPSGINQATVVWEWSLMDHLVQDYDSTKANYGIVTDHPELVNINYIDTLSKDWIHANAVTYNAALDQIIVSARNMSEIWMIDHSATTAQSASHTGGAHGRGGDLLYRWGNPQVYNRGTGANRVFYTQHNPTWIPAGYPHANSIVIFNNGVSRPGGNASSVDIFTPPFDSTGNYTIAAGQAYAPIAPQWSYGTTPGNAFFGPVMGGTQPLANGHIVVCEGPQGNFFEIDSDKNVFWRYINPVSTNTAVVQGTSIMNSGVFRCTQYDASYSAFTGKMLTPMGHIEGNAILTHCDSSSVNAVAKVEKVNDVQIYPNPASNKITIVLPSLNDLVSFGIYDISGQKLSGGAIQSKLSDIAVSGLASGIYFVHIETNSYSYQHKVIINH